MTINEAIALLENQAIGAAGILGAVPPGAKEISTLNQYIEACDLAISALREKQVREEKSQSQWISVKDRMPEANKSVLAVVSGKPNEYIELIQSVEIAEYESGAWFFEAWPGWMNTNVTHWMPLPEAPEMEENR